jgi:hypothetical protein
MALAALVVGFPTQGFATVTAPNVGDTDVVAPVAHGAQIGSTLKTPLIRVAPTGPDWAPWDFG